VRLYPGIDIDVPTWQPTGTPSRTTFAAPSGRLLMPEPTARPWREYVKMRLANLSAAGETLRQVFAGR
jgi:hypothetical protein